MLVVGMCSTKMRDSATFSFTKLHINVLGARSAPSAPSVPVKRYIYNIIT